MVVFCPKPCKSFMSLNFVTLKPSPFKELAACNAFFLIRYRFPLSPLYFLCWFKFLIFWHCGGLGSSVESWKLSIFSPAKFAFQHHKPQLNSFQLCYYSFSSFFFFFFFSISQPEGVFSCTRKNGLWPSAIWKSSSAASRISWIRLSWTSFPGTVSWALASFMEVGHEGVALRGTAQQLSLLLSWRKVRQLVQRPNAVGWWRVSFLQLLCNHFQVQITNWQHNLWMWWLFMHVSLQARELWNHRIFTNHKSLGRSSLHGSAVKNLNRVHEDARSIPGLSQWVVDPALPWAVV